MTSSNPFFPKALSSNTIICGGERWEVRLQHRDWQGHQCSSIAEPFAWCALPLPRVRAQLSFYLLHEAAVSAGAPVASCL